MKRPLLGLALLVLLIAGGVYFLRPDSNSALRKAEARTLSSFDPVGKGEKVTAAHGIQFEQAELTLVLKLYAETSGRSIIPLGNLPDAKFTFSNQAPMTGVEILQALDTLLAAQGITTVYLGTKYVKVVPTKEAPLESGPVIELPPDQLPESSSFLVYIVKLKNVTPLEATGALGPFARLPNSIITIGSGRGGPSATKANLQKLAGGILGAKDNNILILRDYSSNVRRMLQVLEKMEQR